MIRLIYDDVSIKGKEFFKKGEFKLPDTGLVILKGKNGVGKSLLCQKIFSCNKDKNIVLVNQNNDALIYSRSIIENISMGTDLNRNNEIISDLEKQNLDYLLNLDIKKMSGGEKRMVSFLRGYYSDSNIIILDEPSNDLDYKMVDTLKRLIQNMINTKLVLMISHDQRLIDLSDNYIELTENAIQTHYNESTSDVHDYKKNKKNMSFLTKSFRYNFLSILIIMLLFIISILEVVSLKKDNKDKTQNVIRDNQVVLYTPGARSLSAYLFSECIPSDSLGMMNANILKQFMSYKKIKEVDKGANLKGISNIQDCTIYPFEYFDKENKTTIFVLDYYCNKEYGFDASYFKINTTELFDNPYELIGENEEEIKIEKEKYLEYIKELESIKVNGNELELSTVILVFNNKINYESLQVISKLDNTYIRSNDIKNLKYSLSRFDALLKGSGVIICTTLFVCLLNSFLIYILIKNEDIKIRVFKNYNYEKEDLLMVIKKKYNLRLFFLIPYLIFVLFNILLFMDWTFSMSNYFYSILLFFLTPIIFYLSELILRKMIDYRFRWDFR